MTPGRFHAETGSPITIPGGATRDIPARDLDGIAASAWSLPIGDTNVDIQVSNVTFSGTAAQRAPSLTCDIVRHGEDRTARTTAAIPTLPGTWAFVFGGQEYVNDDDGEFRFRLTNNGTQPVTIGKVVVKAVNVRAQLIHDLGGYNGWSDGSVR